MQNNGILVIKEGCGNIQKCCHGIVHIHCKGISLHFTEEAFLSFASMVKEASSQLMDEGLSKLMDEQN